MTMANNVLVGSETQVRVPGRYPPEEVIGADTFLIPISSTRYLVYSPLRGLLFMANSSAAKTVQNALRGIPDKKSDVFAAIEGTGLFSPIKQQMLDQVFPNVKAPLCSLTFSLTYACNLMCVYCYANGGDQAGTLNRNMIEDSIVFVAENSKAAGYDFLRISFHGTGEATLRWDLLTYAVEFAEAKAADYGLSSFFSLTTNGANLSGEMADFVSEHKIHISMSFDGLPDIHDLQRPFRGGQGSFRQLIRSIRLLQNRDIYFAFRTTVLPGNESRLAEIVEFTHKEILEGRRGKIIFEPVEACGRASDIRTEEIDPDEFIRSYKEAVELGKSLNINVTCSGDRGGFRSSFCDANGRIFLVLPDGSVSSCTRVTTAADRLSPMFHYGHHELGIRSFVIHEEKLQNLLGTSFWGVEECTGCFCRWHCAGHCISARHSDDGHWKMMCHITRELWKWRLLQRVETQSIL